MDMMVSLGLSVGKKEQSLLKTKRAGNSSVMRGMSVSNHTQRKEKKRKEKTRQIIIERVCPLSLFGCCVCLLLQYLNNKMAILL
jgi:hypothetical protein